MDRRAFIAGVVGVLSAARLRAEAQPAKVARVGFLASQATTVLPPTALAEVHPWANLIVDFTEVAR